MARQIHDRDISLILGAARAWIDTCLISDGSVLSASNLWTATLVDEVYHAFVEHPDFGDSDFMTKLKGQMKEASPMAKQLVAEMLWALLLFPSNMKATTKRQQVRDLWALSGQPLSEDPALMGENTLFGIGSGGPGFNNYRPDELEFLIALAGDLKRRDKQDRQRIFETYDAFIEWIGSVPRKGARQFRHMLRFFAFPDRVERISSNNDRRKILEAFGRASQKESRKWTDQQLDDTLLALRVELQGTDHSQPMDFYQSPLKERWSKRHLVKTTAGKVTVVVPTEEDDEEEEKKDSSTIDAAPPEMRRSLRVQAILAEIGAVMGLNIWIPRGDRARVRELISGKEVDALLDDLPLNYDDTTLDTIEQIDVLWLNRRSIVRAFEVEHTTAVYSGLLRMADLLALQPNMDIRLHIVAPDERRDKVFREMQRPVFSLLERGPLSNTCTFLSYESVEAIRALKHLAHTTPGLLVEYEEAAEAEEI
jgi:hypothetical protein